MNETGKNKSMATMLSLLRMEMDHEREEFRRFTENVGIGRSVKRGDCWFPVRVGKSYYNSLNQFVVELYRNEEEESEHNFEYGKPVMFFRRSGINDIEYFNFGGTVSYVDGNRMVAVVRDATCVASIESCAEAGVQLSFDETTYKLMIEAVNKVMNAKGNRLAYLRDIFYNKSSVQKLAFMPMSFPWLNKSQEKAVNEVLWAKDVRIIHGPPGTGKTTTLVEAIYETLRRENQVLVCAQSNMAVDWISEQLMDRGIDVLRIGNPTRVNDKMLGQTYERRYEAHPDYPQLWKMRKTLNEIKGSRKSTESYHQKVDRLKNRITELEMRIHNDLFAQARVISCTLASSASRILEGYKFDTLFIDEAAQALEAACWIAITKAKRVIFAGDHQQLPPTIKCYEALKGGLGITLMQRIAENNPQVVDMLTVQYRMNEEIMEFSNQWFYKGEVQSAPEVKNRSILDMDIPVVWIDTGDIESKEEFVGVTYGRINKGEAQLALSTLQDFFEKVGIDRVKEERLDVGIISPYRAQVHYMRHLIKHSDFFRKFKSSIAVNTVDGFQGQERDIIIISLVRANDAGDIGFLRDLRRMNVAMTRARMKLIILGDVETLTHHPFYNKLYKYVKELGDFCV